MTDPIGPTFPADFPPIDDASRPGKANRAEFTLGSAGPGERAPDFLSASQIFDALNGRGDRALASSRSIPLRGIPQGFLVRSHGSEALAVRLPVSRQDLEAVNNAADAPTSLEAQLSAAGRSVFGKVATPRLSNDDLSRLLAALTVSEGSGAVTPYVEMRQLPASNTSKTSLGMMLRAPAAIAWFSVSPDGISLSLVTSAGNLDATATLGKGRIGIDATSLDLSPSAVSVLSESIGQIAGVAASSSRADIDLLSSGAMLG